MGFYVGDTKYKIIINNVVHTMKSSMASVVTDGIKLLSSDNLILKDSNQLYLTAKKEGE